jgi:hypothetical protein
MRGFTLTPVFRGDRATTIYHEIIMGHGYGISMLPHSWPANNYLTCNNYLTWKDRCLAKPKIGRTLYINFSRTTDADKVKVFDIFIFLN